MMDFVSWDDDIPNIWKVIKAMFETTNQLTYSSKMRCNHLTTEWGNTIRKKGVPIAQSHMSHTYNYIRFSCDIVLLLLLFQWLIATDMENKQLLIYPPSMKQLLYCGQTEYAPWSASHSATFQPPSNLPPARWRSVDNGVSSANPWSKRSLKTFKEGNCEEKTTHGM